MQKRISDKIINNLQNNIYSYDMFMKTIINFFNAYPALKGVIHSLKYRLKDSEHLRDKLSRKDSKDNKITIDNYFEKITDIAGVRVMHLFPRQFDIIHKAIIHQVDKNEWFLNEIPIAYTWDPESVKYFESFKLDVKLKESFYTSVHYVLKPRVDSNVTCEVQVRTLFEEVWGEIDHIINYPKPSLSDICKEQIGILARLIGAGTKLADSIYKEDVQYNKVLIEKNKYTQRKYSLPKQH